MSRIPRILEGDRTWVFARLVAIGLLRACAMSSIILIVRFTFDILTARRAAVPFVGILWVGPVLATVGVGRGWLAYQSRVHAAHLGQEYAEALRLQLYDHLATLSVRSIGQQSTGDVLVHFSSDVSAIRRWITRGMARGLVSAITFVLTLAVIAWLDLALTLTLVAFLAVEFWLSRRPTRLIRRAVTELRRRRGRLMANVGEVVGAMRTIQVFGQARTERVRFARRNGQFREAAISQARVAGVLRAVMSAVSVAARAGILVAGANEVVTGRTTLGTVAAALTVSGLLSSHIRGFGRIYVSYQRARVARRQIMRFFNMPSRLACVPEAPELGRGPGRLEFDSVTLNPGVARVSAVAQPGTLVVVSGPNGAGKSTLLQLACRLIDPDEGRVLIDAQDLSRHSLESVRRTISMSSADLPLLHGSVGHNLNYRWPDAPAEEIARTRALCRIDRMLATLPEGEKTTVLEGGRNLSLGQRQRINLARALLGSPVVLLLDEADTNLDEEGAGVLDAVLEQFRGTVIMVSHDPRRIQRADCVWSMDSGRIVQTRLNEKGG
jgi:ABC-type multidrug transport system fused ATPase/permease subunit